VLISFCSSCQLLVKKRTAAKSFGQTSDRIRELLHPTALTLWAIYGTRGARMSSVASAD